MTAKEAYELISEQLKDFQIVKCMDYSSVFVFQFIPKNVEQDEADHMIDCLRSVNKVTGVIRDFKPFHISINEYTRGYQVHDFR